MLKTRSRDKNPSKLDENKVNSKVKESIKVLRSEVYPNLTDEELKQFNNKLSNFLFF